MFIAEKLSNEVKGIEKRIVLDGAENKVLKNVNARKDSKVKRMIYVSGIVPFAGV